MAPIVEPNPLQSCLLQCFVKVPALYILHIGWSTRLGTEDPWWYLVLALGQPLLLPALL
jgi:hypothetical protein